MHDTSYECFRKFFSYLKDERVINLENWDLLTEYLQNGFVTFDNLTETKSREAKTLFKNYVDGTLKIE